MELSMMYRKKFSPFLDMNLIVWNYVLLFQVMTRYISNPDNLKLMMNMLKEKSRNIQFEAFHVFKVWNL